METNKNSWHKRLLSPVIIMVLVVSTLVLKINYVEYTRAQQFSPNILVDDSLANTYEPDIAVDGNGKLHAVWHDTRSSIYIICYSNSTDDGATWSPCVRADNSPVGISLVEPSIAVDKSGGVYDGNLYVIWRDRRNGDYDIFVSTSTDSGITWSADVRVDNAPVAVYSYNPSIAVDDGGAVYVAWDDNRNSSNNIYISRSDDGGITWNPDVQVSTPGASHANPSIATFGSGTIYIAWNKRSGPIFSTMSARSVDSGDTWSGTQVTKSAGNIENVDIAVDRNEKIYLTWIGNMGGSKPIFFSSSSTQGASWTYKTRVDDSTGVVSGLFPKVGVNLFGVYVVWEDNRNGDRDIFFSESRDGGITWGDGISNDNDIRVNDNPIGDSTTQSEPNIVVNDWDIHVIWSDQRSGHDVYFASYIISLLWITEFQDSTDGNELIEIFGFGGKDIDLTGYYLSPDGGVTQWDLTPLGIISPDEYRSIGDASGNLIIPALDLDDESGIISLHNTTGDLRFSSNQWQGSQSIRVCIW